MYGAPIVFENFTSNNGNKCTQINNDPWATGSNIPCCSGTTPILRKWDNDGRDYFKCMNSCTPVNKDPWEYGSLIQCCDGLEPSSAAYWGKVMTGQPKCVEKVGLFKKLWWFLKSFLIIWIIGLIILISIGYFIYKKVRE